MLPVSSYLSQSYIYKKKKKELNLPSYPRTQGRPTSKALHASKPPKSHEVKGLLTCWSSSRWIEDVRATRPELRAKLLTTVRRNLTGEEIPAFLGCCCVEACEGRVVSFAADLLSFFWGGMVRTLQMLQFSVSMKMINCSLLNENIKLSVGRKHGRAQKQS